jgi:hypothetical protein
MTDLKTTPKKTFDIKEDKSSPETKHPFDFLRTDASLESQKRFNDQAVSDYREEAKNEEKHFYKWSESIESLYHHDDINFLKSKFNEIVLDRNNNINEYLFEVIDKDEFQKNAFNHHKRIKEIVNEYFKVLENSNKETIKEVLNNLAYHHNGNPSSDTYDNPFSNKFKDHAKNRIFQLDYPSEHSNIESHYTNVKEQLTQWCSFTEHVNSTSLDLQNSLPTLETHQTDLQKNFEKYRNCSRDHEEYNTNLGTIQESIKADIDESIASINNTDIVAKLDAGLHSFKRDKSDIRENPYLKKFEDTLKERFMLLSKELHEREQAQFNNLQTILDKAGLPIETQNNLLDQAKFWETSFEDYQKDPSKHEDYNNKRKASLEQIDTHITGPIQDHLAKQDPYIVHQVYNEISKIEDPIPPIEHLKTFLEGIKDFPDHVDISESVESNPELKYRVFNLPGIEKHAMDSENKLQELQSTRIVDVLQHYQQFLTDLRNNSQASDGDLQSKINNVWDLAEKDVPGDSVSQYQQFLENSAPEFNTHIKNIFNKIGELKIDNINEEVEKLHDDIVKSDTTLQDRKKLRQTLETEQVKKDLNELTDFLQGHQISIDSTNNLSGIEQKYKEQLSTLKQTDPAKLYQMYENLKDTKGNVLLDNLKTHIGKFCRELANSDKDYHEKTQNYLKVTHDFLDKLNNSASEAEKAQLTGFNEQIKTDLPNIFEKYNFSDISQEKSDISQEKWKARVDYYEAVDACKNTMKTILGQYMTKFKDDNDLEKALQLYNHVHTSEVKDMYDGDLKKQIDTSMDAIVKAKHEQFKKISSAWDNYIKEDKFKDEANKEHVAEINQAKEKLKEELDAYNSASDKDNARININTFFNDFNDKINKLPQDLQNDFKARCNELGASPLDELPDLKLDNAELQTRYDAVKNGYKAEEEKIKKKQDYVNKLPDDAFNKQQLVNDLNANIKEREELLKTFKEQLLELEKIDEKNIKNVEEKWHAASQKLQDLDTAWDKRVEKYTEQNEIYKRSDREQQELYKHIEAKHQEAIKALEAKQEKIEKLEAKIAALMEEIDHLKKSGINPIRAAKAAAGLLDKIGSWLRHPFSREKRRAYLEKAISDARTEAYDTASGEGKPSEWRKVKDFFKQKLVRRTIKIVAATGLVVGSIALAGPTGGASFFAGITVGVMWYCMERDDKKAKMERSSSKHDEKLKDLTLRV